MSSSIFTRSFWRASAERAIKSFAYAASALLIGEGSGLLNADWEAVLSVAGMSALLSLLGSIVSDAATGGSGPSLTNAESLANTVATTAPEGSHIDTHVVTPKEK